jgi:hypothetical protein
MPGTSEACARVALTCLPPKGMVYFPNPFPDQYADCTCGNNPLPYTAPGYVDDSATRDAAETARRAALCGPGSTYNAHESPPVVRLATQELEDQRERASYCQSNLMAMVTGIPVPVLLAGAAIVLFLFVGGKR